jgi:predicted P-loop ATPase
VPEDAWQAKIEAYLEHRDETKIADIAVGVIGLRLGESMRPQEAKIASVLTRMGWKRGNVWRDGKRQKMWTRA